LDFTVLIGGAEERAAIQKEKRDDEKIFEEHVVRKEGDERSFGVNFCQNHLQGLGHT
jgi:hypothetical protein